MIEFLLDLTSVMEYDIELLEKTSHFVPKLLNTAIVDLKQMENKRMRKGRGRERELQGNTVKAFYYDRFFWGSHISGRWLKA